MMSSPLLVFDEGYEKPSGTVLTLYTADHWDRPLAAFHRLAIHAQADRRAPGNADLTIQMEHSADRRNWTDKNTTPEINGVSFGSGVVTTIMGGDSGTRPSLSHVRLRIDVDTSTESEGRIRIWVTGRGKP